MITYSIIQKSQLEGALRLDAEYYQPEYFIDFGKGKWQAIDNFLSVCQYGLSQAMNDERIGYPIFKMDDIKDVFLFDDDVRYVDITEDVFNEFKLAKNDVLFNRVNSEEFVGRTGIFKLDMDAVFASYLIRLKTRDGSEILPDYLNIFLNSAYGIKQIRKFRRRAVNQANVNAEELKQIKIAVLPINFQKEIEQLSNESWQNFEFSKFLYSQAENLLLEELGLKDFKVEDDLSYIVNLSEIKSAHRADAEYFQPKYEKIMSLIRANGGIALGDLVTTKKGIEPGGEAYQDEGKLFIRVSSLSKNGIEGKDQKYLSDELYQKLKKNYEPKVGEILLTKDATPGIAYTLKSPVEGIISSGILRLKLKNEKVANEYLALCLNSIVGQMQAERDGGGSVITHWKPEQIKNVLIPVLPKPIQQKIANLVRQSHKARKKAKELLEGAKIKVESVIGNSAKS